MPKAFSEEIETPHHDRHLCVVTVITMLITLKAQQLRRLVSNDFQAAFERCDVILAPAAPRLQRQPSAATAPTLRINVFERYFYHLIELGRFAWHLRASGLQPRGLAHRHAIVWQLFCRSQIA